MIKCQNCNSDNPDGALFCQVCGTKIEAKEKCPSCGKELPMKGMKFCCFCGTKIDGEASKTKSFIGDKNVIAGDVKSEVNNNISNSVSQVINNLNDDKMVVQCSICGKLLPKGSGSFYKCKKCGNIVCVDDYNNQKHTCTNCLKVEKENKSKGEILEGLELFDYQIESKNNVSIFGLKNKSTRSIKIPSIVKTIMNGAFEDSLLIKVEIDEGLELIEANAFKNCQRLKNITLPSTLLEIGDNAFLGCKNLDIIIPENVMYIGENALKDTLSDNKKEIKESKAKQELEDIELDLSDEDIKLDLNDSKAKQELEGFKLNLSEEDLKFDFSKLFGEKKAEDEEDLDFDLCIYPEIVGKYDGETKNGKRNGHGTMIFSKTYDFEDGDKYVGNWKDDYMNGQGIMYYANGNRFEGSWCDGSMNGQGIMYYKNGDKIEGTWKDDKPYDAQGTYEFYLGKYIGSFVKGQRTGKAIMCYDDGRKYEGEWVNDKRNGQGTMYYENGDKYVGEWEDNFQNGKCTYYFADGRKYEGSVKKANNRQFRGHWDGQGTFYYKDGAKYIGEWKDSKKNGQGTYYFADGRKYEGSVKNDKWNGQGTFYWPNGDKYIGDWKDDYMNGQGTYYFADGRKYEGNWKDGKKEGQGTFYWPNGAKYIGNWKSGKYEGQGTYYFADGKKYEGNWKDNKKEGQGTFYWPNGNKYIGEWKDGKHRGGALYNAKGHRDLILDKEEQDLDL